MACTFSPLFVTTPLLGFTPVARSEVASYVWLSRKGNRDGQPTLWDNQKKEDEYRRTTETG